MSLLTNTINEKTKSASFYTRLALIALSGLTVSSCASMKGNEIHEAGITIYDPMEEQNRQIMAFNMAVDKTIINPVIEGYRAITPRPARSGIRNFLRNIRSPITLANQLLQGDLGGARDALLRVVINTSVGVGGIFDVAGYEGIEYEPEDFGQTLAIWGVEHGPYMVIPFIGPSSLRDYSGYFADTIADPLRWYLFSQDQELLYSGKYVVEYLDIRDSLKDTLDDLERNSFDYYAAIRSTYYQHRKAVVNDNEGITINDIPAIPYYEDE
ncbi:MAG: vacJ like lipofamily protein [Zetaproteobacteria bacterium]|nr:MAG: vacJ like lipofamily protein [Zetaproteobacteria bacterium]